jgi:hypothetical protein
MTQPLSRRFLVMIESNKKIRLSNSDLVAIQNIFHKHFLAKDSLWLFGSRVDLAKLGGDIDLYIETSMESMELAIKKKIDFIWDLEQIIGEQKIDVVLNIVNHPYDLPIYKIAKEQGVKIV